MTPELSRLVRVSEIGSTPRRETVVATDAECAALAQRFDLLGLTALAVDLTLVADAIGVRVAGRLTARGEQACAVSAEPVAFALDEPVDLHFSAAAEPDGDEVELAGADLDVLPLDGDALDLGEAVAQSLGLALDPYPRAPDEVRAAAARFVISEAEAEAQRAADKAAASPFAALRRRT